MKLNTVFSILSFVSLCAASINAAPASADATAVCKFLSQNYPHLVAFDPQSPNGLGTVLNSTLYTQTSIEYWNFVSSNNRPACMFFPTNAQQVSVAVKKLNQYPGVAFGLKSGGHNSNLGFSSTNGGVLISFRPNLANTVISADRQTASVGPGARWGEVSDELIKYNKAAVGGRLGHIGVGGFILGGGLSYLSAQYGLSCDNVVSYEVVKADGTIAKASATQNSDLYWALKGGGNQFAILTNIVMKVHNIGVNGQVWGGVRGYTADKHSALFAAISNFTQNYPDPKAAIIPTFSIGGPANVASIIVVFYFYDGLKPTTGVFDQFDAIPSVPVAGDDVKERTYANLVNSYFGGFIEGMRYQIRVNTFPNMEPVKMEKFLNSQFNIISKGAAERSSTNIDFLIYSFAIQPVSVRIARASRAAGGNALGLDPAYGDRIWVENDLSWETPTCDEKCPGYIETVANQVKSLHMKQYGNQRPTNYQSGDVSFVNYNPLFMNDGMYDQDILASYGAANHARLRSIKNSVDPHGFFTNRQGGFKV